MVEAMSALSQGRPGSLAVPAAPTPAAVPTSTDGKPLSKASPTQARGPLRFLRLGRRLAGLAFLIALWQVLSATGVLSATVIASPVEVARTAAHLISDGELGSAMLTSLQRVAIGLLIGGTAGITLALVSGLFRVGEDFVDAPMQMMRTVPFVGLIPLLIIWFGIGEAPKVALVALAVTFPLYLNLYNGIRNTDVTLLEAGRSLGLGRWALIWHVILPGALPNALLGVRIALGVAWLGLVFGEQVSAVDGLGYLMANAQELFRTDVIVVCLIVYALLGLTADLIVRLLERFLLSWRPAFTGQ
jgi:sulfonate transport system permease protein